MFYEQTSRTYNTQDWQYHNMLTGFYRSGYDPNNSAVLELLVHDSWSGMVISRVSFVEIYKAFMIF